MNVDVVTRWFNKFTPEERFEFMERVRVVPKTPVLQAFDAFERWSDEQRVELLDLIEARYCMRCCTLALENGECPNQAKHDEEDDADEDEDGEDDFDDDADHDDDGADETDGPEYDEPDSEVPDSGAPESVDPESADVRDGAGDSDADEDGFDDTDR